MNTATIKGNWNITKGKLKQKYAQLTDDDLIYVEGKEEELLGQIQKRTGHPLEEIEAYLRDECGCDFGPDNPGKSTAESNRPFARSYLPPQSTSTMRRRSSLNASFPQ